MCLGVSFCFVVVVCFFVCLPMDFSLFLLFVVVSFLVFRGLAVVFDLFSFSVCVVLLSLKKKKKKKKLFGVFVLG